MNILPKKKWHVRTKENMERVRRDEAKAADEEQSRLDRAILAENERRLHLLRSKTDERMERLFGSTSDTSRKTDDMAVSEESGHVNLFQDLERSERKNLGVGNKEYEEEKKKEKQEWESKMGIQKCLGEGSNELDKKGSWYEKMPFRKVEDVKEIKYVLPGYAKKIEEKLDDEKRGHEKGEKRKHKKKRRRSDSSSSSSSVSDSRRHRGKKSKKHKKKVKESKMKIESKLEAEKMSKLSALREERIQRERAEKLRAQQLVQPRTHKPVHSVKQKYNSQFNPDLCRN